MSKICYRCNSEIDDNTIFCPECGAIQNAANVNASNNTPVTPTSVVPTQAGTTSTAPTQNISEVTAQVNQQVSPMQSDMMNQMPPQGMMNGMPGVPPMQPDMMNQMPPQEMINGMPGVPPMQQVPPQGMMGVPPMQQVPPQGMMGVPPMQQVPAQGMVPGMPPMQQVPPQGMVPGMPSMQPVQPDMMQQKPQKQKTVKNKQANNAGATIEKKANNQDNGGDGPEKKKGNGLIIGIASLFGVLLITLAIVSFYYVGIYQKNIKIVQKASIEGYPNDTYKEAFEGYFDEGKWKYFKDSSGDKIVEFTGKKKVDGKRNTTVVRFTVDGKDVEGSYLEINGEAKSSDEYDMMMNIIFATANGSDYVDFSELDEDDIDNAVTEETTETTTETTEATTTEDKAKCPYEYEQKVVVTVEGAASSYATLELMEWDNGDWVSRFSCNAMVGKSGVGGDYGEGKNITPIGTFKLGPVLTTTKAPNNLDYYTVTADTCVVDDVNSDLYNIITDTSSVPAGVSCDKIGNNIVNGNLTGAIFIQHNGDGRSSKGVVPGKGSVITICGCSGRVNATAGCVDISSGDYSKLLELLNGDKKPVIEIKVK